MINLTLKYRRFLAIGLSPIIGELSFLTIFLIINWIDSFRNVIHDGPEFDNGLLYGFFFPILFGSAIIFQLAIFEPIYFNLKNAIY